MPKALCGVPACSSNGQHETCVSAFNCHVEYLLRNGYERINKREFINVRDGHALLLAKPRQFGGTSRVMFNHDRAASRRVAAILRNLNITERG